MIKMADCVDRGLYRLRSRNLTLGVYRAEVKGFIGIREKFGPLYLDTEYLWEPGPPFGTARSMTFVEQCPVEIEVSEGQSDGKVFHQNQPLFDWLTQKQGAAT